jgi:hypothetical protein
MEPQDRVVRHDVLEAGSFGRSLSPIERRDGVGIDHEPGISYATLHGFQTRVRSEELPN